MLKCYESLDLLDMEGVPRSSRGASTTQFTYENINIQRAWVSHFQSFKSYSLAFLSPWCFAEVGTKLGQNHVSGFEGDRSDRETILMQGNRPDLMNWSQSLYRIFKQKIKQKMTAWESHATWGIWDGSFQY